MKRGAANEYGENKRTGKTLSTGAGQKKKCTKMQKMEDGIYRAEEPFWFTIDERG